MAEGGNFDRWERELDFETKEVQGAPQIDDYLSTIPLQPTRHFWHQIELARGDEPSQSSLALAKQVQVFCDAAEPARRRGEFIAGLQMLSEQAEDIRDGRHIVTMSNDRLTALLGGYSFGDEEGRTFITLRMYEVAYGVKDHADIRSDDGRRLAGPVYVPVLAVDSLFRFVKR